MTSMFSKKRKWKFRLPRPDRDIRFGIIGVSLDLCFLRAILVQDQRRLNDDCLSSFSFPVEVNFVEQMVSNYTISNIQGRLHGIKHKQCSYNDGVPTSKQPPSQNVWVCTAPPSKHFLDEVNLFHQSAQKEDHYLGTGTFKMIWQGVDCLHQEVIQHT